MRTSGERLGDNPAHGTPSGRLSGAAGRHTTHNGSWASTLLVVGRLSRRGGVLFSRIDVVVVERNQTIVSRQGERDAISDRTRYDRLAKESGIEE